MAAHRATRNMISDLDERMDHIERMLEKTLDHVDFLSMRKLASAVYGHDSTLLRIPWSCMDDVEQGMDSLPKLEALERLLTTDAVSDQIVHFARDVIQAFFTPEFQGHVLLGLQARYVNIQYPAGFQSKPRPLYLAGKPRPITFSIGDASSSSSRPSLERS